MEGKMNNLSIGTAISILVIVLAIISIGSIILAFEACPSQALNFSNNGSEEALDRIKIGDILANPAKYQFGLVTVIGEYRGWQGEGIAPPITRSDWVIKDDTGLIYVTGLLPGFDPVEDIGLILEVSGMVRVKEGEPYIEAKSVKIFNETKIGDILANPAKYQFGLVTVIGEYRGWQGEGIAPPTTYSDWVIKDDTGLIYVTGLLPGLDAVEDIGLIVEVSGTVRVKEGEPYIEAKNIKLFNETKIGDILANPAKYQFDLVTVIGEYRGWQGEGTAPPITYSDWVINDDSGLIYVTGLLPGLDAVEDIGLIVEVSGTVRVKEGEPYIEAKSVKLFDETEIGDILANPAKYQFDLVTVIGEYRGWQGEGIAPPITYSDWVIKDDTGLIYVTGLLPGFDPVEDIGLILEVSGMGRVKEGEPYIEAKSVNIFNETEIGDILANPAKYQFGLVTVIGEYRGWQGEGIAPPITYSDWVIKDDTGLIYVTGLLPGLDAVEDIGLIVEVSGTVRVKEGEPYIEAKNIKLFNETKIGDILANPAKYQFDLVTVIGEYRGWQGEGTAPPITYSDWVINDDSGLIYVTGLLPGFDPVEDIGQILEVSGMVRVKEDIPYIIALDITLHQLPSRFLPQKGDCKFKDTQKRPKRTYFQVFDNLNLVRSVLKIIFKP